MRMVLGLDRPTSGTALVNGRPFATPAEPLREVGALLPPAPSTPAAPAAPDATTCASPPGRTASRSAGWILPKFRCGWMTALAHVLPGSGAASLLLGEVPGMTKASSVTVLLARAGGALPLGWLRLTRDDPNR